MLGRSSAAASSIRPVIPCAARRTHQLQAGGPGDFAEAALKKKSERPGLDKCPEGGRPRLLAYLDERHYGVRLSREELHRVTLWLDCNSEFYGAYHDTRAQGRGEIVMPALD